MYEDLEQYLQEIDRYLVVPSGAGDILSEIESHILDKTKEEYGELSEENVKNTIAGYGSAREVAEKYLEETHIIAPVFRKYLFRYTWIVFAFHAGLAGLLFILESKLTMFPPLFAIPRMETFLSFLNQLPMIWVYDFGLVTLFLFFITQSKKKVDLPWPVFGNKKKKRARKAAYAPPRPHAVLLLFMSTLFIAGLYFFFRYGTIFFKSLNFDNMEPLLSEPASVFYSLVVIIWIGLEIMFHTLRYLSNTFTLELVKNLVFLLALWGLMNVDIGGEIRDISWLELPFTLKEIMTGIIVLIALIMFIETLEIVYKMVRNRQTE
jgi:hypothetical protein